VSNINHLLMYCVGQNRQFAEIIPS